MKPTQVGQANESEDDNLVALHEGFEKGNQSLERLWQSLPLHELILQVELRADDVTVGLRCRQMSQ